MNDQDVFGTKITASHVTNAQSTSDFSNSQLIGPGYMTNMASHGRTGNPGSFPHSVQGNFSGKIIIALSRRFCESP